MSCPGTTKKGLPCKNGTLCHVHCPPCGPECSICLNPTTRTRSTKKLRCGHEFHNACIKQWTQRGGEACPMCRQLICPSKYKVSIHIENTETNVSNEHILNETAILELFNGLGIVIPDQMDMQMIIEHDRSLERFLNDLHIRLSDVDSLIFDAEGPTIY
jgi:hypothetical protein